MEGFRVLAQTRSLNKRVVESQNNIWKEGPRVSFIYSRSLKFRAVENERRNTRSRKLKKRKKKTEKKTQKKKKHLKLSYDCKGFIWTVRERHL